MQDGRLDFEESALFEVAAAEGEGAAAGVEDFPDVGVGDEVEVALAVAEFLVLEAVPLAGQRQEGLGEEFPRGDAQGGLAGLGREVGPFDADEVAEVGVLEGFVGVFAHGVALDVDLEAVGAVLQVREKALAHEADGHQAAGGARGLAFFVAGADVGEAAAALERAAVGALARGFQGFEVGKALVAEFGFKAGEFHGRSPFEGGN